jgi:hypothetical protein
MHYEKKVKPKVLAAKAGKALGRGENVALITKLSREAYENETDEVKEQVAERMEEQRERRRLEEEEEERERNGHGKVATPAEMQG